jgi:hypothetical protein
MSMDFAAVALALSEQIRTLLILNLDRAPFNFGAVLVPLETNSNLESALQYRFGLPSIRGRSIMTGGFFGQGAEADPWVLVMRAYRFKIHNGTESENLGILALADDDDAIAFGKSNIRDLMAGAAKQYSGWVMDITEGERVVCNIPFN